MLGTAHTHLPLENLGEGRERGEWEEGGFGRRGGQF